MIPPDRFIIQSKWETEWLEARAGGVTATAVAECATPSGFEQHVLSWSAPFEGNEYTAFGSWAERYLLDHAHRTAGILPSDWLIASANEPMHMGTPDGLSLDHTLIAEAKTGGKLPKSVPRQHRDQCLWNLYVTDADRCLYLFMPRMTAPDGSFYMGLLDPITFWVERDPFRESELRTVADRIIEAKEQHRARYTQVNF